MISTIVSAVWRVGVSCCLILVTQVEQLGRIVLVVNTGQLKESCPTSTGRNWFNLTEVGVGLC